MSARFTHRLTVRTGQRPPGPRPARRGRTDLAVAALLVAAALAGCGAPPAPEAQAGATASTLAAQAWFGAFTYGGVWQGMEPVLRLERELGRPLDVVHWFMDWDHAYDPAMVEAVLAGGAVPLISWQPMRQDLHDIVAGRHDAYLRTWAHGVGRAPGTVYLRPFPEMNGDWVPWSGDPDALRHAWTHLAELFAREGVHNVRWVWSPNVTDEPRTETNRLERYYPGDDHVDVLALSGYNWGETRPSIGWRSFGEVFADGYGRVAALGPQPVWLTELASSDAGGDKADWVRDMLASTAFPRIAALVWFDEDKEADWRVTSHPDVLQAFRQGLGVGASLPLGPADGTGTPCATDGSAERRSCWRRP